MTEAAVTAENVAPDVTDAQVGEFFESGGEKAPESTAPVTETVEAAPKEPSEIEKVQSELKNIKGALGEERGKRKEEARRREAMEQRFQQLMERVAVPQQQAQIPPFEENPAAHLLARQQQLEQGVQHQVLTAQQAEQQRQYQAQLQGLNQAYRTDVVEFSKEAPDVDQAINHLGNIYGQKLVENGVPQEQLQAHLLNAEMYMADLAYKFGTRPAAFLYALAQANGYKPKPKQQQQPNMDALQKGAQTKSLSTAHGPAKQNLTLEALAEMDDKDFEANWDKLIKAA